MSGKSIHCFEVINRFWMDNDLFSLTEWFTLVLNLSLLLLFFLFRLTLKKRTVRSWSKSNVSVCSQRWGKWILTIRFLTSLILSYIMEVWILLQSVLSCHERLLLILLFLSEIILLFSCTNDVLAYVFRFFMMHFLNIRQSQSWQLMEISIMKGRNLRYS